jgi:RNA polymerase subunit RPABC4/transcription elongation factor Spt4
MDPGRLLECFCSRCRCLICKTVNSDQFSAVWSLILVISRKTEPEFLGYKSMVSPRLEVHMPDMKIGRGTCRFVAKKNEGGPNHHSAVFP